MATRCVKLFGKEFGSGSVECWSDDAPAKPRGNETPAAHNIPRPQDCTWRKFDHDYFCVKSTPPQQAAAAAKTPEKPRGSAVGWQECVSRENNAFTVLTYDWWNGTCEVGEPQKQVTASR